MQRLHPPVKFREAPNGDLLAPRRGSAPDCPVGYEATNDPFIFSLLKEPCMFRTIKVTQRKCCGGSDKKDMFCDLFKKKITLINCKSCQSRVE